MTIPFCMFFPCELLFLLMLKLLNPKVHSPLFAATVAPLQLYQEDPVCQRLGLNVMLYIILLNQSAKNNNT